MDFIAAVVARVVDTCEPVQFLSNGTQGENVSVSGYNTCPQMFTKENH